MLSFRSLERADFRGFFLFFGRWILSSRLLSLRSSAPVRKKELFACAKVCDHRAFAPREAPRIANSKRAMILSRTFVSRVSFRARARGNEFRTTIFGFVVFRPCLSQRGGENNEERKTTTTIRVHPKWVGCKNFN